MPTPDLVAGLTEGDQIVLNRDGTASIVNVRVVKTSAIDAVTTALNTGDVATGMLPYGCIYRSSYKRDTVYFMAVPPTIDTVTHERGVYQTEPGGPRHRIQFRLAMPWRVMAIGVNSRGNVIDCYTWITKEKPKPTSQIYHPTVPNRYQNGHGCLGERLLTSINKNTALNEHDKVEQVAYDMQRVDYADHMPYWRDRFPDELQAVTVPAVADLPGGLSRLNAAAVDRADADVEYNNHNRDVRRLVKWHLWTAERMAGDQWRRDISNVSWQPLFSTSTRPLHTLQDALNGNRGGRGRQ